MTASMMQERLAGWEGEVAQADLDMASTICNPVDTPHFYRVLCKKLSRHRIATIEECAKACEQQAKDFLSPEYATGQPLSSFSERFACGQCAEAICSLAPPPPPAVVGEGK